MSENYEVSYIEDRLGKYVAAFLKPYIEQYEMKIDIYRSSDKNIYLVGPNGEHSGSISAENGIVKYLLFLDSEGTLSLSGEINHQNITGAIGKMNSKDRSIMTSFTTFSMKGYEHSIECNESYYSYNVYNTSQKMIPKPFTWTWKEIKSLLMTYGSELTPSYEKNFENISFEEFMNEIMQKYGTPSITRQKAV